MDTVQPAGADTEFPMRWTKYPTLELGGSLQLKDITQIEDIEFVGDPEANVVTCVGSASGRAGAEEDGTEETEEAEDSVDSEDSASISDGEQENN